MPKRRKTKLKKQNGNAKRDRISDLPDAILAHILGKLPTKNAVGTSILSTRWKGLFAQLPNPDISIDDKDLLCSDEDLDFDTRDLNFHCQKASFIDFMYNLLNVTLHDVPRIRKFHLDLCINYDFDEKNSMEEGYLCHDHVNKWIFVALKLNVPYLWFFCPSNYNGTPDGLFNCASLVEIMLHWNAGTSVPSSVFLPNLKCLYLKRVLFHNDGLREVLSGCPVLVELCLWYCEFSKRNVNDVVVVRVFSNSVKKFRWFRCIKDDRYGTELDMSALDILCYNDYLPDYFLVKNLNSLHKSK